MNSFRRLMILVLCAGTLAGVVLFAVQHFTVVPLIEAAERYEHEEDHHAHEWKPAEGWERTAWTALTTVMTGIGFAALLFGFLSLTGRELTWRQGLWWGIAAYACLHLAPALGLPPLPPGVPVPDVRQRQLWWTSAVVAAAAGLWLMSRQSWWQRTAGVLCMAIPHIVGAPLATGVSAVPAELIRRFSITSLASTACFWVLLGATGGWLASRGVRSHQLDKARVTMKE